MSNFSIQWVKYGKNAPLIVYNVISVLIQMTSSNNTEMPQFFIGKNDYFCIVYIK